jgi:adenosylhomocysteinase
MHTALAWARLQMPLTRAQLEAMPPLDGVRLACSIHLTSNIAPALDGLLQRGAALFLNTCNPATVQAEVVDWLKSRGAEAEAWRGMGPEDEARAVARALAWGPTHVFEMGANLASAAASGGGQEGIRAGLEVTGSGIARLERLQAEGRALSFPVFNCDDVPIKEGLHNRHVVGLVTWITFTNRARLSLHGRRVLVVGYGSVGEGVAAAGRAWGGSVAVAERDPARALQARFAGFEVGSVEALLPAADVVVTATGARGVLGASHRRLLKPGCFLLNVGHSSDEIDVAALGPLRAALPFVEAFAVEGGEAYLFAGGAMANLAAGQGDALNTFDVTLATMLAGLRHIFSPQALAMAPGIQPLPRQAWLGVAEQAAAGR